MTARSTKGAKKRIPPYIAEKYKGGSRGFKATKRRQLKALEKAFCELRLGCAHIPGYPSHVSNIAHGIRELKEATCEKAWGR